MGKCLLHDLTVLFVHIVLCKHFLTSVARSDTTQCNKLFLWRHIFKLFYFYNSRRRKPSFVPPKCVQTWWHWGCLHLGLSELAETYWFLLVASWKIKYILSFVQWGGLYQTIYPKLLSTAKIRTPPFRRRPSPSKRVYVKLNPKFRSWMFLDKYLKTKVVPLIIAPSATLAAWSWRTLADLRARASAFRRQSPTLGRPIGSVLPPMNPMPRDRRV